MPAVLRAALASALYAVRVRYPIQSAALANGLFTRADGELNSERRALGLVRSCRTGRERRVHATLAQFQQPSQCRAPQDLTTRSSVRWSEITPPGGGRNR